MCVYVLYVCVHVWLSVCVCCEWTCTYSFAEQNHEPFLQAGAIPIFSKLLDAVLYDGDDELVIAIVSLFNNLVDAGMFGLCVCPFS